MATLPLHDMPDDVKAYVLKVQVELKIAKKAQISQQATIYHIIKEHKKLTTTTK